MLTKSPLLLRFDASGAEKILTNTSGPEEKLLNKVVKVFVE